MEIEQISSNLQPEKIFRLIPPHCFCYTHTLSFLFKTSKESHNETFSNLCYNRSYQIKKEDVLPYENHLPKRTCWWKQCPMFPRAVCAKSPIPALEGILLKAEEGTLELTGYDLELGIVTTIESKTEQAGELVLSARLFAGHHPTHSWRNGQHPFRRTVSLPPSVAVHRNLPSPA